MGESYDRQLRVLQLRRHVDGISKMDPTRQLCSDLERRSRHILRESSRRKALKLNYSPAILTSTMLLPLLFAILIFVPTPPLAWANSSGGTSLPRSSHGFGRRRHSQLSGTGESASASYNHYYPPWNPSSLIDEDGFLTQVYQRIPGEWESEMRSFLGPNSPTYRGRMLPSEMQDEPDKYYHPYSSQAIMEIPVQVRQVPGDGNCLFHSISLCLHHAVNGTHWDISPPPSEDEKKATDRSDSDDRFPKYHYRGGGRHVRRKRHDDNRYFSAWGGLDALYEQSQLLRQKAVQCLQDKPNRKLFLQGRESLKAHELVQAAAQQYSLSCEEYCESMAQDSVWGGGPEIVALCNILQRPIHVYELATVIVTDNNHEDAGKERFVLRRMACFGSPKFDRRPALHILSADSRFPDLQPGQQLAAGNHFLAVFPCTEDYNRRLRRQKRLRQRKKQREVSKEDNKMRGGGSRRRRIPFFSRDVDDEVGDDESRHVRSMYDAEMSGRGVSPWIDWWHRLADMFVSDV